MRFEKLKRLAVSCGGTGGHFYPGLTVARTFKDAGGLPALFLCGKHVKKQAETAAKFGIDSFILSSGHRSGGAVQTVKFAAQSGAGVLRALRAVYKFKPDAVLSMGSFASAPAALASKLTGVPFFIHDGNARLGKANILFSRLARRFFLSFPAVNGDKCKCPSVLTGMPVRLELLNSRADKKHAFDKINSLFGSGLSHSSPTLLIFGGSQGAETVNKTMLSVLTNIRTGPFQVIHLTGAGKFEEIRKSYADTPFKHLVLESSEEMALFYQAADMVVCRSGGGTISELALFGKYALLVPYPYAAEDHQNDNAAWHASSGGAEVIQNREFTPENISPRVEAWLDDTRLFTQKGRQALKIARPEAAKDILSQIEGNI